MHTHCMAAAAYIIEILILESVTKFRDIGPMTLTGVSDTAYQRTFFLEVVTYEYFRNI